MAKNFRGPLFLPHLVCSAEVHSGWGRKLNDHLMASCVWNICTKNYQNLLIGFQVGVKNVEDMFLGHSVVAYDVLYSLYLFYIHTKYLS